MRGPPGSWLCSCSSSRPNTSSAIANPLKDLCCLVMHRDGRFLLQHTNELLHSSRMVGPGRGGHLMSMPEGRTSATRQSNRRGLPAPETDQRRRYSIKDAIEMELCNVRGTPNSALTHRG
jgi:hypothetical protein